MLSAVQCRKLCRRRRRDTYRYSDPQKLDRFRLEFFALRSVRIHKICLMCFKLLMDRFILTDAQWAKMEPHCLGKPADPGRSGSDNRLFIEAVLWIVRTGSPWRDLPEHFGNWSTAFRRFSDWRRADVFAKLFEACSDEPDLEYAMVDATIVKVHRHGQGSKGDSYQPSENLTLGIPKGRRI